MALILDPVFSENAESPAMTCCPPLISVPLAGPPLLALVPWKWQIFIDEENDVTIFPLLLCFFSFSPGFSAL